MSLLRWNLIPQKNKSMKDIESYFTTSNQEGSDKDQIRIPLESMDSVPHREFETESTTSGSRGQTFSVQLNLKTPLEYQV